MDQLHKFPEVGRAPGNHVPSSRTLTEVAQFHFGAAAHTEGPQQVLKAPEARAEPRGSVSLSEVGWVVHLAREIHTHTHTPYLHLF